MSTDDEMHASRLHGEALNAAREVAYDIRFREQIQQLADATDNPTLRAQTAGQLANEALADLGGDQAGLRFIAAGLLLTSGKVDLNQLEQTVRQATAAATPHSHSTRRTRPTS